jgi:hypothetical protein
MVKAGTVFTPEDRERINHRNAAALDRRKKLAATKAAEVLARHRRQMALLQTVDVPVVQRDAHRLLKLTTAQAQREADIAADAGSDSQSVTASGFILHGSASRATPSWIAGVHM